MTTETAPRGYGIPTQTAFALLVAVLVAAPACLLAVYLTPQPQRAEVAWTGGGAAVLWCAAVTAGAFHFLTARRLRELLAEQDTDAASARAAAERFAEATVPDLVARLRDGASADTALAAVPPGHDDAQRRLLRTLATEVHQGRSLRASAMAACANAAGRVQALTTSMAADLREMEDRHSDPGVLGDLLHLDHRTAQAGRLADSIAVLTGARSGRRWTKPIRMESVLRGAMGRIQGYQRVRLHSTSTVAVVGHAAEGIMHALAEVMDNAANFSPPTSEVHVYVEEMASGVVVTVEDGGLVMGEIALRRAEAAVAPRSARDLTALPGTRLGLTVVGRLAHKHGLSVAFRPSAHGGTGVVLRIPQELVTEVPDAVPSGRERRPGAAEAPPVPARVPHQSRDADSASGGRPATEESPTAVSPAGAASPTATVNTPAASGGRGEPDARTRSTEATTGTRAGAPNTVAEVAVDAGQASPAGEGPAEGEPLTGTASGPAAPAGPASGSAATAEGRDSAPGDASSGASSGPAIPAGPASGADARSTAAAAAQTASSAHAREPARGSERVARSEGTGTTTSGGARSTSATAGEDNAGSPAEGEPLTGTASGPATPAGPASGSAATAEGRDSAPGDASSDAVSPAKREDDVEPDHGGKAGAVTGTATPTRSTAGPEPDARPRTGASDGAEAAGDPGHSSAAATGEARAGSGHPESRRTRATTEAAEHRRADGHDGGDTEAAEHSAEPTAEPPAPPAGSNPTEHSAEPPAPPAGGNPVEYGDSGLPKRRRGRTMAAAQRATEGKAPPRPARSAAESAARFGAFRRAVQPRPVGPEPTSSHPSSRPEDDAE